MLEIDAASAQAYLIRSGRISARTSVRVTALTGGISNEVLLVETDDPAWPRFVLKQARAQLRTPQEWRCTVERIWREVSVMRQCRAWIPCGEIPEILFEDRENYLFAMTAAPADYSVWRDELLAGRCRLEVSRMAGRLLGRIHAFGWNKEVVARQFADQTIFRELRLDPYYRTVAAAFPPAAPLLEQLIASVQEHRSTLVHADFSPKNLLVGTNGIFLVDFETGHFGDPAFDLGFFLSHLVLKAFYHLPNYDPVLQLAVNFCESYSQQLGPHIDSEEQADLERRGALHLAGCLWARLDGTSRVDYLTDERRRTAVRQLARRLLEQPARDWSSCFELVRSSLSTLPGAKS